MDIKEKSVKEHIVSIQQRNESSLTKQDTALLAISNRLEDTNRSINAGNAIASKMADALRLDWLRQLGAELKGFMRRIIAMNIATYHAVISIQSSLPGRLERCLAEEPFILEDAFGRVAPVHLQFVTSWEAFNAVLEIRFKDIQGFEKIKKKQYGLQEKATRREIDQNRPWQRAFLPGQRINMSFIFDTSGNSSEEVAYATCPGCFNLSDEAADADIHYSQCGMFFRRITVIQETEPPPQVPVPRPWKSRSEFGKPGFTEMVSRPARPGKRRTRPSEIEEVDVRDFKRVRLIAKQQRVRHHQFGKVGAAMTFANLPSKPGTESILLHPSSSHEWKSLQTESFRAPREDIALEDKDMVDINEADSEEFRREELITKLTSQISAHAEPAYHPPRHSTEHSPKPLTPVSTDSVQTPERSPMKQKELGYLFDDVLMDVQSATFSSHPEYKYWKSNHPPHLVFVNIPTSEEIDGGEISYRVLDILQEGVNRFEDKESDDS
jgi:hypothetical protein